MQLIKIFLFLVLLNIIEPQGFCDFGCFDGGMFDGGTPAIEPVMGDIFEPAIQDPPIFEPVVEDPPVFDPIVEDPPAIPDPPLEIPPIPDPVIPDISEGVPEPSPVDIIPIDPPSEEVTEPVIEDPILDPIIEDTPGISDPSLEIPPVPDPVIPDVSEGIFEPSPDDVIPPSEDITEPAPDDTDILPEIGDPSNSEPSTEDNIDNVEPLIDGIDTEISVLDSDTNIEDNGLEVPTEDVVTEIPQESTDISNDAEFLDSETAIIEPPDEDVLLPSEMTESPEVEPSAEDDFGEITVIDGSSEDPVNISGEDDLVIVDESVDLLDDEGSTSGESEVLIVHGEVPLDSEEVFPEIPLADIAKYTLPLLALPKSGGLDIVRSSLENAAINQAVTGDPESLPKELVKQSAKPMLESVAEMLEANTDRIQASTRHFLGERGANAVSKITQELADASKVMADSPIPVVGTVLSTTVFRDQNSQLTLNEELALNLLGDAAGFLVEAGFVALAAQFPPLAVYLPAAPYVGVAAGAGVTEAATGLYTAIFKDEKAGEVKKKSPRELQVREDNSLFDNQIFLISEVKENELEIDSLLVGDQEEAQDEAGVVEVGENDEDVGQKFYILFVHTAGTPMALVFGDDNSEHSMIIIPGPTTASNNTTT